MVQSQFEASSSPRRSHSVRKCLRMRTQLSWGFTRCGKFKRNAVSCRNAILTGGTRLEAWMEYYVGSPLSCKGLLLTILPSQARRLHTALLNMENLLTVDIPVFIISWTIRPSRSHAVSGWILTLIYNTGNIAHLVKLMLKCKAIVSIQGR